MREKTLTAIMALFCIARAVSQSLMFSAEQQHTFVNADCGFVLTVLGAKAGDVTLPDFAGLPPDASLVSSSKMPLLQDGAECTQIRVRLSFSRPGTYSLPSMSIRHRRQTLTAHFPPVEVHENLADLRPLLTIRLYDAQSGAEITDAPSLPAGTKIRMRCYVRYAANVRDIAWTLPEDALFSEIMRNLTENSQFSPQAQQVAEFIWQPLTEGAHALPDIYVTATAYNGAQSQLYAPRATVRIVAAKPTVRAEAERQLFAEAFAEEARTVQSAQIVRLSQSELRSRAAEYKRQLTAAQKIMLRIGFGPRVALFAGGIVRAVPEEKSASTVQLQGGAELRVMQKAGRWLYIKSGAVSGWVKETDIYLIQ